MKKTILIGAMALALGACSEQLKENSNVIQVDIENAQPMNLADFVESIQLVPLETTDESLIKRIERMVIQDGKVYIQNDLQDVLVFDENGKFLLSTAQRRGQGPEDYFMMMSMDVTNDGLISIYEGFRIREYDMDLNLVNSYFPQLPDSIHSALEKRKHIKLDDDIYLFRDNEYTSYYSASKDSVLSIKHEHYHPKSCAIVNNLRLLEHEGEIYFSPSYICDTLYRVNMAEHRMEPVIAFHSEEDINLDEMPDDMTFLYYVEYMMNTEKMFMLDKVHLPHADFCFMANVKDKKGGIVYRDKHGKVKVYYQKDTQSFPVPHAVYENKLVFAAMPEYIEEMDMTLVDAESLERIKDLKEDDNQVLVIYTVFGQNPVFR